jgi:non-ribosomal peptide synthetase component F
MSTHVHGPLDISWEQQRIRARCLHPTGTFTRFMRADIEQSLPARFEQQVAKYPDRLALKTRHHTLTYEELNRAANRIAQGILVERGSGEEPIALLFETGTSAIAAMFSVLKAGKGYVPLAPSDPHARIAYILQDSQASVIATNAQHFALAQELARDTVRVINVDQLDPHLPAESPGLRVSPDTLASILYTSGSTGLPSRAGNHRSGNGSALLSGSRRPSHR